MKKIFVLTVLLTLWSSASFAEEGKFGLGFVIGDPTAVSAKYFLSEDSAIDLQGSISGRDYFLLWSDYLYYFSPSSKGFARFANRFHSYVGIGALGAFATRSDHSRGNFFDKRDDDFAIGARVPFGVEWFFKKVPLGIGLEVVPTAIITPTTKGVLMGGLSLRFYF